MYKKFIDHLDKHTFKKSGPYDFPLLLQNFDGLLTQAIPFNYALSSKKYDVGIHFFIDDYQFERIWNHPDRYVELILKFNYMMTPDFSLFTDMPKAMQIWNRFRSLWIGSYFQSKGAQVIPTISWSDEPSFDWVFDGIQKHSIVAISSVGCLKSKEATELFLKGYYEMVKKIEPSTIIFYGKVPDGIDASNVYQLEAFQNKYDKLRGDL